ncbi:hypothetical protein AMTRI_Chr10g1650 [Amborella trichopoda]|nr:AFP homolog 2 [Amborella trichopoda]|eukprot:XP_006845867.2 AFP homolog 2 [Amborella trichopoda]
MAQATDTENLGLRFQISVEEQCHSSGTIAFPRDLLQRLMASDNSSNKLSGENSGPNSLENDQKIDWGLNLGLSLGGRFGLDRSSSVIDPSTKGHGILRSSSLPATYLPESLTMLPENDFPSTERQIQAARRLEVKKKREEKQQQQMMKRRKSFDGDYFGFQVFGSRDEDRASLTDDRVGFQPLSCKNKDRATLDEDRLAFLARDKDRAASDKNQLGFAPPMNFRDKVQASLQEEKLTFSPWGCGDKDRASLEADCAGTEVSTAGEAREKEICRDAKPETLALGLSGHMQSTSGNELPPFLYGWPGLARTSSLNNSGSNSTLYQPIASRPFAPSPHASLVSQGSSSSGFSEFDSRSAPGGSSSIEAKSPMSAEAGAEARVLPRGLSVSADKGGEARVLARGLSGSADKGGEARVLAKGLSARMPCVTTKGEGPNGKRVEGVLYNYSKGEEVSIVCVCHGTFLTPAEFVRHAGGGDVDHPLRHIVVINPSPS